MYNPMINQELYGIIQREMLREADQRHQARFARQAKRAARRRRRSDG